MAYVITQRCCNDASCLPQCPVDCIRPTREDPAFASAEMLYIDPGACIDCGACVEACPVGAIHSADELPQHLLRFEDINARYFERHPLQSRPVSNGAGRPRRSPSRPLRVVIVGSGPAACYAANDLLRRSNVQVDMLERLPTPWGLVRAGVAPDHSATKAVSGIFEPAFKREAMRLHLNVEAGRDVSHEELLAHAHAVIYAVGASSERRLGIPGEDLPGSHAASRFVAWYNGHPDFADTEFDLSGERVVIVGNGNVALDAARILLTDPDVLARTDIADHALHALRESKVREVVLLGRRGPLQAAYSSAEFLALDHLDDVDVVIDGNELVLDPFSERTAADPDLEPELALKLSLAEEYSRRPLAPGRRRIVFRYRASPVEILGEDKVESVKVVRNELVEVGGELGSVATDDAETLDASLVLRSIGYRGEPVPGVPFDDTRGVIPNLAGRVTDQGSPTPGVYVTGWIKRGPRGVIGTNRDCALETVEALIDDFEAGVLDDPPTDPGSLGAMLRQRQPDVLGYPEWSVVDRLERQRGRTVGRPRVKLTTKAEILDVIAKSRG
ncbi:FAD-dependent oxidoreductase [Streptomyces sp. NPDC002405]